MPKGRSGECMHSCVCEPSSTHSGWSRNDSAQSSNIHSLNESSRQMTGTLQPCCWALALITAVTIDLPEQDCPHTHEGSNMGLP